MHLRKIAGTQLPRELYDEYERAKTVHGLSHAGIVRAALKLWLERNMGYEPSEKVKPLYEADETPRENWQPKEGEDSIFVPGFRAPPRLHAQLDDLRWGRSWHDFMRGFVGDAMKRKLEDLREAEEKGETAGTSGTKPLTEEVI